MKYEEVGSSHRLCLVQVRFVLPCARQDSSRWMTCCLIGVGWQQIGVPALKKKVYILPLHNVCVCVDVDVGLTCIVLAGEIF